MPSKSWSSCLSEDDFSCPVCCEVFTDPVVLLCSHSFCEACLKKWWRQKKIRECPLCKRKHAKNQPLCANLALKNVCEAFALERRREEAEAAAASSSSSEEMPQCALHAESLNLFCRDCQLAVCVVCLYSEKHACHSFRPVEEAGRNSDEQRQQHGSLPGPGNTSSCQVLGEK